MSKGRSPNKWNVRDCAEFTYRDGSGREISVFALDRNDAITTLAQHGIRVKPDEKVYRTGKYLAEFLAEGTMKQEPIDR